jgi:mannose-6-phosphate isomerase-like protein (cupin superfamily)
MLLELEFGDERLNQRVEVPDTEAEGFEAFFSAGIRVLERLGGERSERRGALRLGRIAAPGLSLFRLWFSEIEARFPVAVETPFEGSDFIGGGAWLGAERFSRHPEDALAKLCFVAGAVDLPMHAHEHSDRFIVVLEGEGSYHHAPGPVHEFAGEGVRSVPVRAGDVIVFTRGLVHTFSTPRRAMTLLSWHRPYLAFLDPRQYTLPTLSMCPDGVLASWHHAFEML